MMPTVQEERTLAFSPRGTAWRSMSTGLAIVFFVLTTLAVAALYGFCELVHWPSGLVTAIASIAVAEVLIWRFRFWGTGVESALWITGLFAFIISIPSTGKPEAILVFAAAAALAGWRVRNPLFGTLAIVLIVVYLAVREWPWATMGLAVGITVVALAALTRMWRRPSTEMLWNTLVVIMPIAGYVAGSVARTRFVSNPIVIALFLLLTLMLLGVGIVDRIRGPLMAASVTTTIAIIEAHDFISLSVEAQLIVFGAIALALAAAIMRVLRGKERGFVIGEPGQRTGEALQILTMLTVAAADGGGATSAGTPHSGGGEFGGAGASGQY